uniref:PiggyBac transposable element-derived protein domain-containing protein n=1 Tax=Salmo trutta TaxID=8032 RepID=A0A673X5S5_SALTR
RLLNAYAEPIQTDHDRNNVISDDDLPPPPTPSTRPATALIPKHIVYSPNAAECVNQSCPNPMDVFLLMYPPTLREITIEMSNLHSTQTKDKQLCLSLDELLTFYVIFFTSGYSTVPRRHMYWSLDSDVHNGSISDAMRRNRFDEIMASVHVVDNTKITDDPFFKVRPIFSELNQSYKVMPFQEWLSQFMSGKPIRFGYKLRSLASSSDWVESGTQCISCLAEQSQAPQGCKFLHDNLFTSLALLHEMTKRGHGSSGTMRQSRPFDVPFKPQKDFMKLPRGTSEVLTKGDKLLVRWKDNNIVTVATTMKEKYSETSVKTWNKERRAFDKVPQPKCINRYNEHMGGVDLHDLQDTISPAGLRSGGGPSLHGLNSALVNSHFFYRDVMGGAIDLLTFSWIVAQSLMQMFGTKPLSHGRRSLLAATFEDQKRYDKASHWPINMMHRFERCHHCDKRTTYACEKCKVPLHIECFKLYHGQ